MSAELIAVIAVGVALAGLMLTGLRGVRVEMHDVREEMRDVRSGVADLCEHMARLEGLFEGFAGRTPSDFVDVVPGRTLQWATSSPRSN